jgi:NitT/TauT family transport system permease protein
MPADTAVLDDTLAGLDALEQHALQTDGRAARAWRATWPKLLALAIVLGVWQLLIWIEWKPPFAFASPVDTFTELGDMVRDGRMGDAVATTMWRAVKGFAFSIVLGVVVGGLVARVAPVRAAFGSLIGGLQTMPSVAWVPFAILIFQRDAEQAMFFVMVLGAAPSIANRLVTGADHIPPILLRAGRVLGAKGLAAYRHVILPAALPSFVAGLKQGWAFLWRSLMAAELLETSAGAQSVGFLLFRERELANIAGVMAVMVVILVIGIAVDALVFGTLDRTIRRRWGLLG